MSDPFATDIMVRINDASQDMQSSDLINFNIRDGLLYHNHLLYVPFGTCRTRVLRTCHDDPLVGHFGVAKTLVLLSQGFWWPQPWKLVKEFIKTCNICARRQSSSPSSIRPSTPTVSRGFPRLGFPRKTVCTVYIGPFCCFLFRVVYFLHSSQAHIYNPESRRMFYLRR